MNNYTKSTALRPFLRPSFNHDFLELFSKKFTSFTTATSSLVDVGLFFRLDSEYDFKYKMFVVSPPVPTMLNQLIIDSDLEQFDKRRQLLLRIHSTE